MKSVHVDISVMAGRWPEMTDAIKKASYKTISLSGFVKKNGGRRIEVSIVLADDKFIKKLNKQYRGKNKPTNVLSFPAGDDCGPGAVGLGDVILAIETIREEAKAQGKRFQDHFIHLIIHGILHLIGYDHESPKQAKAMESLEIRILKSFGVNNPYEI